MERMEDMEYRGYKGSVEYNPKTKIYYGQALGLENDRIIYDATTLDELRHRFETSVDEMIKFHEVHGYASNMGHSIIWSDNKKLHAFMKKLRDRQTARIAQAREEWQKSQKENVPQKR